jgi:hypothetical protein
MNLPATPPNLTLAPLLEDGRNALACLDIAGMQKVVLKRIMLYHGGNPWHRITHEAEDIFALADLGLYTWPPLEQLYEAEFALWTLDSQRSHRLIIRFPDTVIAKPARNTIPDGSSEPFRSLVISWMKQRRFLTRELHGDKPTILV